MSDVLFRSGSKLAYLTTQPDVNTLYFCEDTGELFKGKVPFSKSICFVDKLPEQEMRSENIIYMIDGQGGMVFDSTTLSWKTLIPPIVHEIKDDTADGVLHTVGALRSVLKNYIGKHGGTITGYLILEKSPTENLHAVNKLYVDSVIGDLKDFGTVVEYIHGSISEALRWKEFVV